MKAKDICEEMPTEQEQKTMLKKWIKFQKKEGDDAMPQWLNSLSEEDRNKFFEELDKESATMYAALKEFREAVIEVYNKILPHTENIVKALSDVENHLTKGEKE